MTHGYKFVRPTSPGYLKTEGFRTLTSQNVNELRNDPKAPADHDMAALHIAFRAGKADEARHILFDLGADPTLVSGPNAAGQKHAPPEKFIDLFQTFNQQGDTHKIVTAMRADLQRAQEQWTKRPGAGVIQARKLQT